MEVVKDDLWIPEKGGVGGREMKKEINKTGGSESTKRPAWK